METSFAKYSNSKLDVLTAEEAAVIEGGLKVKEVSSGILIWKEKGSRVAIYSSELIDRQVALLKL